MLNPKGPASTWAAAAVLSSTLAQYLASRESRASELSSEVLAWAVLPTLFKSAQTFGAFHPKANRTGPETGTSPTLWQWAIAGGVAALELFKEDDGMVGLWLALPPLILAAQRYPQTNLLHLLESLDVAPDALGSSSSDSRHRAFRSHVASAALAGILAFFSNLALARWRFLPFGISVVLVAAIIFALHRAFLRKTSEDVIISSDTDVNNGTVILSLRVCVGLVIALLIEITAVVALDLSMNEMMPTIYLGLAKAASWFFLLRTARDVSWIAAISIGTFAIMSSLDPSRQSSAAGAFFNVMVACASLAQTIGALSKQDRFRNFLWALCLLPLVPWSSNILAIRNGTDAAVMFSMHHSHPVETLMLVGETDFKDLLQRQSQSLDAARAEYRRRYRIEPPEGFDAWYDYAVLHGSPIIDDFDTIYKSVSPFWRLSGDEVMDAMRQLQSDPKLRVHLWRCQFSGQSGRTHCTNPARYGDRHISVFLNRLLGGLHGRLPDITMLVNHLDEPMVVIPPSSLNLTGSQRTQMTFTDMTHRPTWDAITKYCAQRDEKANATGSTAAFLLPFVDDVLSSMDLCQHPEYRRMHGLFMSPTSAVLAEGLAPILSNGAPSTMGDILIPSAAYIESAFRYDEKADIAWESKSNNLYWAGSNTGGYASDDSWRLFQRQRFLSLAQNRGRDGRQYQYLRAEGGIAGRVASSFLNSRLFDVSLTRIIQCKLRFCRDQQSAFDTRSWADKNAALKSKLAFDLDGNGISGRWLKLLASNSMPLKQTLFREWHDERLIPWVHYVPVSQAMEELPELVTYFLSTEAGQQRAREIAEQGREWFGRAFREVDMGIYMYRLMLEFARLQDPSREADLEARP